jgi:hypothetical protein
MHIFVASHKRVYSYYKLYTYNSLIPITTRLDPKGLYQAPYIFRNDTALEQS